MHEQVHASVQVDAHGNVDARMTGRRRVRASWGAGAWVCTRVSVCQTPVPRCVGKSLSGQRALDFVLQNRELIDKTLLFNVKLIRVDKPDKTGGKLEGRR